VADELEHVLHQRLGIGARDQHVGGDFEFEIEEMGLAREVGDWLLLAGPAHQVAVGSQVLCTQRPLVVGVELDAGNFQDMRKKQFGRQPRRVDVFAGEESGRPLQDPPDRPRPAL